MIRPCSVFGAALAVALVALPRVAQGEDQPITPQSLTDRHVIAAMDAIIEELYERLHPTSFWEPRAGYTGSQYQVGGYTALVALALLYAGESYQEPRLREAIRHLEEAEFRGTYAVAVRLSLWSILPPRFAQHLRDDAKWLLDGFSDQVGSWAYVQLPTTARRDNSLRQYGALGLWEAAKRGTRVPPGLWQSLEHNLLAMQLADGGWNYNGNGPATGSMTAAGLSNLFIIQDLLHSDQAVALGGRRQVSPHQQAIDKAMQWMHKNFSATENPGYRPTRGEDDYFFYYLYGVERVGLAGGHKYFGGKDWYRHGCAELIRRLCSYDAATGRMTTHEREGGTGRAIRNTDLAFALMFLSRGRMPSIINKLQDDTFSWNNRPRDVPNLAVWIAGQSARHVIWQITDINAPGEEWLDAPLQYMASHEAAPWAGDADDPRLRNLQMYLDRGGLLFAVNEGSGRAFAQSIERAGTTMYPQYRWRTLPGDHWAYTIHQPVRGNQPTLRGLSNGVRELIILAVDGDMPATFQGRNTQNRPHYHTAGNIYFYASERDRPRPRLASLAEMHRVNSDAQPRRVRGTMHIVRARYAGNWDPEPQALNQFVNWLDGEITIGLHERKLAQLHQFEHWPALAVVSGVEAHRLTPEERRAISEFVARGGTILFETAGGMGSFATEAEAAVTELLRQPADPLLRHRIITGAGLASGDDLSRLNYRPYTLDVLGSLDTTPRLRGIVIDGRPRVVFSREDLSHALLDQPCWGVMGYTADSARKLLRNIMLHMLDQQP